MKQVFSLLAVIVLLASCSSSRDYLLRGDEDKTIFDIVKRLNKKSSDEDATKAIAQVYAQVKERHLKKIETYNSYNDITKWDKLVTEYTILQNIFNAIDNSEAASRLVSPQSFYNELNGVKEAAAEDYYQLGNQFMATRTREAARNAYNSFKKAASFVRDYKDSRSLMDEAYNNSVINVVINPIQDNSFFFNTGWGIFHGRL